MDHLLADQADRSGLQDELKLQDGLIEGTGNHAEDDIGDHSRDKGGTRNAECREDRHE